MGSTYASWGKAFALRAEPPPGLRARTRPSRGGQACMGKSGKCSGRMRLYSPRPPVSSLAAQCFPIHLIGRNVRCEILPFAC